MPVPLANSCPWAEYSSVMRESHDHEWGEPVAEAVVLFEYVVVYTFQLGFDFPVVLKRREVFRELLANFDPDRLARWTEDVLQHSLNRGNGQRPLAELPPARRVRFAGGKVNHLVKRLHGSRNGPLIAAAARMSFCQKLAKLVGYDLEPNETASGRVVSPNVSCVN